jgi:Cupin superfamily protein
LTRLLEIDPERFSADFARRPFTVEHSLTEHPLLSVESIARLAERIPEDSVEHNRGDVPEVLASGEAPQADLTPGEIARGIETNGCWMVLKHIEQDPEYKRLLDEALDEVAPLVSDREGGMHKREGFIFLSAPNSVTPSHIDPEHNFLLQVRGWKEMHVGSFSDPEAEQQLLERYYSGGHRNIDWKPEEATNYRLDPGDGVYVPVHAPHFVRNGDGVSVSLSITWFTPTIERDARVYALNARLRRLGLSPAGPGQRSDSAKAGAVKALSAAKRTVKGRGRAAA